MTLTLRLLKQNKHRDRDTHMQPTHFIYRHGLLDIRKRNKSTFQIYVLLNVLVIISP